MLELFSNWNLLLFDEKFANPRTWHWNGQINRLGFYHWRNQLNRIGRRLRLVLFIDRVLKGEKRLAHGVGEGDGAIVDKGQVTTAPANQCARNIASQCARTE